MGNGNEGPTAVSWVQILCNNVLKNTVPDERKIEISEPVDVIVSFFHFNTLAVIPILTPRKRKTAEEPLHGKGGELVWFPFWAVGILD